jgi:hypothetical protein
MIDIAVSCLPHFAEMANPSGITKERRNDQRL